MNDFSTGIAG